MTGTLPREALTASQLALIVSIDTVLQQCGLILTCPRCAADGFPRLSTDNDRSEPIWKIDCHCRERRAAKADLGALMVPSGDLLLLVDQTLRSAGLAVRCPTKRCLLTPLDLTATADGVMVRCNCASFTFRKTIPTPAH